MLVGWTDKHGPAVYDGEHVTYMKKKRPVQHAPHHFFVLDEWVIMAVDRFVSITNYETDECRLIATSKGICLAHRWNNKLYLASNHQVIEYDWETRTITTIPPHASIVVGFYKETMICRCLHDFTVRSIVSATLIKTIPAYMTGLYASSVWQHSVVLHTPSLIVYWGSRGNRLVIARGGNFRFVTHNANWVFAMDGLILKRYSLRPPDHPMVELGVFPNVSEFKWMNKVLWLGFAGAVDVMAREKQLVMVLPLPLDARLEVVKMF